MFNLDFLMCRIKTGTFQSLRTKSVCFRPHHAFLWVIIIGDGIIPWGDEKNLHLLGSIP